VALSHTRVCALVLVLGVPSQVGAARASESPLLVHRASATGSGQDAEVQVAVGDRDRDRDAQARVNGTGDSETLLLVALLSPRPSPCQWSGGAPSASLRPGKLKQPLVSCCAHCLPVSGGIRWELSVILAAGG
jgi:hypothetical protein